MSHRALGRQFFHVSDAEFKPGDKLLPRRETGVRRSEGGGETGIDSDHVYMTDDIHAATGGWGVVFANETEKPQHVYEVEPHGKVTTSKPYGEHDEAVEHLAKSATVRRHLGTVHIKDNGWPEYRERK